jgi:N-acetylglucosamine kinase-like BadF-type ATPase
MSKILIVDSGATKTSWLYCCDGEKKLLNTKGLNPYFVSVSDITKIIQDTFAPLGIKEIDHLFFYGADCDGELSKQKISQGLKNYFVVKDLYIEGDLLGSARAACGNESGVCCILGTGSNACIYDGKEITQSIGGLGYVLGDEGSGAYLGRLLVRKVLNRQLSNDLLNKFFKEYSLTPALILDQVYSPNRSSYFLASLTHFLKQNNDQPEIREIIKQSFDDFIKANILLLPKYKQYKINSIGSIGFYFKEFFILACKDHELEVGQVIDRPIDLLYQFHINNS